MIRPIELGPDPTVLGEHFCGGPLRQHAEQGSLTGVEGHTLAQCTACGELVVVADRERPGGDADAWWRK